MRNALLELVGTTSSSRLGALAIAERKGRIIYINTENILLSGNGYWFES